MLQPQVLIVEDDRASRKALRLILEAEGANVICASNLAEGFASLHAVNRVVLDLMLPDGNGIELLRRVREQNLPIEVAVVTAANDPDLRQRVEQLRPDAFFSKPLQVSRLVSWAINL